MSDSTPYQPPINRQFRLFALILLPVLAIMAVAYFTLFKSELAVLARDVRADEAAAIVAELKKQDVAYELRQQGSTILVSADRADELRLSLVAGDVASAGSVGFELFNQSDMGLTDFAQKVNYQRALQGELARTMMGMDGIASARVHLALPERSLFRSNRSELRAAVTILPKPNIMLDSGRISGIQRLVASTVPELKPENVAVLNQRGQLVSADPEEVADSAWKRQATALERAYAERVGRAISLFDPELSFDVRVTTIPRISDPEAVPAASSGPRDHMIRVVIFTAAVVPPEHQTELSRVIASAIGARPGAGDDIRFSQLPQAIPQAAAMDSPPTLVTVEPQQDSTPLKFDISWMWLAITVVAGGFLGLLLVSNHRQRLVRRERLVTGLREQLRLEQVTS